MRPFQYCVATCHSWTCWRTTRLKRRSAPTSRTSAPRVSPRDQPARSRRPLGPVIQTAAPAITNEAGTVANWGQRTSVATTDAAAAIARSRRRHVVSARTISHEHTAYHGSASTSGTSEVAYDMPGMRTARRAPTIAVRRGTSMRASRYVGTAASVITTAFTYLITAYAVAVEWIHQIGAIRTAYSDLKPTGCPRRAAWPVSEIAREIWVHSSSSVKTHGVFRSHASTQ